MLNFTLPAQFVSYHVKLLSLCTPAFTLRQLSAEISKWLTYLLLSPEQIEALASRDFDDDPVQGGTITHAIDIAHAGYAGHLMVVICAQLVEMGQEKRMTANSIPYGTRPKLSSEYDAESELLYIYATYSVAMPGAYNDPDGTTVLDFTKTVMAVCTSVARAYDASCISRRTEEQLTRVDGPFSYFKATDQ